MHAFGASTALQRRHGAHHPNPGSPSRRVGVLAKAIDAVSVPSGLYLRLTNRDVGADSSDMELMQEQARRVFLGGRMTDAMIG